MERGLIKKADVTRPMFKKACLAMFQNMYIHYGGVSSDRIVDVCIYGAYRYHKVGKYTLNHVIGEQMVIATASMKRGQKFYQDKWLKSQGLTRNHLESVAATVGAHPLERFIYVQGEDATKKQHHNTEAGFFVCQLSTTGWTPRCKWCQTCDFTERCIKGMEKNYEELLRLRREEFEYECEGS